MKLRGALPIRTWVLVFAFLASFACSSSPGGDAGNPVDPGISDGGDADAGTDDGGDADGGSSDAGALPCDGGVVVAGDVSVLGEPDAGGVLVSLLPGGQTAISDSSGHYQVVCVAPGFYALHFSRDGYSETIPTLQVGTDGGVVVLDDAEYPLAPLELQRGPRLLTAQDAQRDCCKVSEDFRFATINTEDDGGTFYLANLPALSVRLLQTGFSAGSTLGFDSVFSDTDAGVVFWVDRLRVLHGISSETGPVTTLDSNLELRGKSGAAVRPVVSSTKLRLALYRTTTAPLTYYGDLKMLDLLSGSKRTLATAVPPDSFAFMPNGTIAASHFGGVTDPNLLLIPLDGGVVAEYTGVSGPWFSDDGSAFAFLSGASAASTQRSLYVSSRGSPVTEIATDAQYLGLGGDSWQPRKGRGQPFSPNSGLIVFTVQGTGGAGTLYVSPVDSASKSLLSDSALLSEYRFSPDGTHVLFHGDGGLTLVPLDGGSGRTLSNGSVASTGGLGTTPDGRVLPFVDERQGATGTLKLFSFADGGVLTVARPSSIETPIFTGGSSYLLFRGPDAGFDQLSSTDMLGTVKVIAVGNLANQVLYPSAEGTHVAYFGPLGFQISDVSTGQLNWSEQLGMGPGLPMPWTWSPDGSAFALVKGEVNFRGDLWAWSASSPTAPRLLMRGVSNYVWAGPKRLLVARGATSPPYRFQNGVYVVDLR